MVSNLYESDFRLKQVAAHRTTYLSMLRKFGKSAVPPGLTFYQSLPVLSFAEFDRVRVERNWVCIQGVIYDVSSFTEHHPGGAQLIRSRVLGPPSYFEKDFFTEHTHSIQALDVLASLAVAVLDRDRTTVLSLHSESNSVSDEQLQRLGCSSAEAQSIEATIHALPPAEKAKAKIQLGDLFQELEREQALLNWMKHERKARTLLMVRTLKLRSSEMTAPEPKQEKRKARPIPDEPGESSKATFATPVLAEAVTVKEVKEAPSARAQQEEEQRNQLKQIKDKMEDERRQRQAKLEERKRLAEELKRANEEREMKLRQQPPETDRSTQAVVAAPAAQEEEQEEETAARLKEEEEIRKRKENLRRRIAEEARMREEARKIKEKESLSELAQPTISVVEPSVSELDDQADLIEPSQISPSAADADKSMHVENPPATDAPIQMARALYDFEPADPACIPLKEGTIVEVLQSDSSGWWQVKNNQNIGYVPGEYLEIVEQKPVKPTENKTEAPPLPARPKRNLVADIAAPKTSDNNNNGKQQTPPKEKDKDKEVNIYAVVHRRKKSDVETQKMLENFF